MLYIELHNNGEPMLVNLAHNVAFVASDGKVYVGTMIPNGATTEVDETYEQVKAKIAELATIR